MRELRAVAKRLATSLEEQDAKDLLAKSLVRVIDPKATRGGWEHTRSWRIGAES